MQRFPGRTLEELDGMDWPRYLKALDAGNMEAVEDRRQLQQEGKINASDIDADEWEQILAHDRLLNGD